MYAFDTSFLVDVIRANPDATRKLREMESRGEAAEVPSPALAEVLLGAHLGRASELRRTLDLASNLSVVDTDRTIAMEAARLGAELVRKGTPLALPDLLIAATAKVRGDILLTRDAGFARVAGLAVEAY